MPTPPRFDDWSCPLPLRDHTAVTMAHGGGGTLSAELVEHLFRPAFRDAALDAMADAALLPFPVGRLAVTTDVFVVRPLFFPGGSIGDLAVNGTVNDLAMSGADPLYLTAAFVLEEGLPLADLAGIVRRMADAARAAGVRVVAGDTKVVERGRADGCYVATTGVGVVPEGVNVGPDRARPGDVVLVSGTLGDHGIAVLSAREGLAFETAVGSDTAPLNQLVRGVLAAAPGVRAFRDPTRGGLAATLNEIAARSHVGMLLEDSAVPIAPAVQSACEMLGLDPLTVANEGKLVAVVPPEEADAALAAMRALALGRNAAVIGRVTDRHPGTVAVRTALGGTRVLPMPVGELLPRIC
jgi:hydrogenase expression/formation protein HypE